MLTSRQYDRKKKSTTIFFNMQAHRHRMMMDRWRYHKLCFLLLLHTFWYVYNLFLTILSWSLNSFFSNKPNKGNKCWRVATHRCQDPQATLANMETAVHLSFRVCIIGHTIAWAMDSSSYCWSVGEQLYVVLDASQLSGLHSWWGPAPDGLYILASGCCSSWDSGSFSELC
jgi:hypothetical protein